MNATAPDRKVSPLDDATDRRLVRLVARGDGPVSADRVMAFMMSGVANSLPG